MAGEQVCVVGGANSAGQAALHLARFAARGHAAHTGGSLAASVSGYLLTQLKATPSIGVGLRTRVAGGHGRARLAALTLEDVRTGQREQVPAAAVLIMIGAEPHTQSRRDLVTLNHRGFTLTGRDVPPGAWALPVRPCRSRRACQAIKTLAAQIRVVCAPRTGPDKAITCNWAARCAGDPGVRK